MAVRPALVRAYAGTAYCVHLPDATHVVAVGASAPALDAHGAAHGKTHWGIVTAVNPASVRLPDADNAARQRALARDLHGFPVRPAENVDPTGVWPVEPAYWVAGMSLADLVTLASRYGQWAIVFAECGRPARLEWTPDGRRTVESGP